MRVRKSETRVRDKEREVERGGSDGGLRREEKEGNGGQGGRPDVSHTD